MFELHALFGINKRIALVGIGTLIITAQGFGNTNTVTFDSATTNNALMSGFIITGATGNLPNGNGIYCNNGSPTITHNTISWNNFHGIYCYKSSPSIYNNIITKNGTIDIVFFGIHVYLSGSSIINYNCVWKNGYGGNNNYSGCSAGPNDISSDPQFIEEGINFHIGSTSPCIDKGTNIPPGGLPLTDKDGNSRIINDIVDMGAYEYQGTSTLQIGTITGVISYTGNKTGTIAVFAMVDLDQDPVALTLIPSPGTYTLVGTYGDRSEFGTKF